MNKYIYLNEPYIPKTSIDASRLLSATFRYIFSNNDIVTDCNRFDGAYNRAYDDLRLAMKQYYFDDLFIKGFYWETAVKSIVNCCDTQIDPLFSPIFYFDKQISSLSRALSYFSLRRNYSADVRDNAYFSALNFIDNYIILNGFDNTCKFVNRLPKSGEIIGVGDLNINIIRLAKDSLQYAYEYVYKKTWRNTHE